MSSPPSADEIETMDICRKIQNEDKSDNSLEAFLEAEETNNDDEGATAGTSQQQANTKESSIIELD